MYIKNITDEEIVVAGLGFEVNEKRLLTEVGTSSEIEKYAEEILYYFNNSMIEILYPDETKLTNSYRLLKLLSGVNSEVSIVNISEFEEALKSPEEQRTNDYYYNNYQLNLDKGQSVDLEFKGYLKSATLRVFSGKISAQIISEPMNKVVVEEQNVFEMDTDNKLLNPIMRLTAVTKVTASIFVDGSYYDETGKKTKAQYLDEIYNRNTLPKPTYTEDKVMDFSIDFRNQDLISGTVIEDVNKYNGTAKGFIEDSETLWTKTSCVEFNSAMGISKDEEFTHSIFLKPIKGARWTQYFLANGQIKIWVSTSGRIYVWVLGKGAYIGYVTYDIWNHILITYNKEKVNIYLNTNFAYSLPKPTRNYTLNKLEIGNYSISNLRYGFIGEIGRISSYNYFFSEGMVYHLYKMNHPNNEVNTNMVEYVNSKYFKLDDLDETPITKKFHFDILEKEYRKIENVIYKEKINKIDFTESDFYTSELSNYFVVNEGIFSTIENSYYTFKLESNQYAILTIDDREVAITSDNNGEGSIYLPEGKHKFKHISVSFNDNSYFYCKIYDDVNQDWIFFNLYQNDIDDESSNEEDITKLITIKDGVFNIDNIDGSILDTNNSDLVEYDGYKMLQYKGDNYSFIKGLSEIMKSNIFSISFILKINTDRECYLFTMGGDEQDWQIWLGLRYVNRSLELNFNDKRVKSDKIKTNTYYQIDIVSNGTDVNLVINAKEDNKKITISDNDWFEGDNLYFNRLPNGATHTWMKSDFEIDNFNYYSITKNKENLENSFIENSKIYDFSYIFSK